MENNLILVSDWDLVEKDDFYLSTVWEKPEDIESIKRARELQEQGQLFHAYIVDARKYAIYYQMDADKVFINEDADIILHCETAMINNNHKHRQELKDF